MRFKCLLFLLLFSASLFAQNFNGQWRGGFVDNSTAFVGFGGQKIDYVLELDVRGTEVTGYSYTYFSEGEKRFYTICKLKGNLNRTTKELTVSEFERTKFNTPPDFRNCFQTHKLKYNKENPEEESLTGTWIPASGQEGDCGFGKTTLIRKIIKPLSLSTRSRNTSPLPVKKDSFRDLNREQKSLPTKPRIVQKEVVKKPPVTTPKQPVKTTEAVVNKNEGKKEKPATDTVVVKPITKVDPPVQKKDADKEIVIPGNYEKRNNKLVETINIRSESFKVDFYDDGIVDGDSISVFYNGRLLLSHQRLSEKPITLTIKADPGKAINELVMYAENLGEIPPNTALMIVHDGNTRYEVRLISDTEKNASIRFNFLPR